MYAVSFLPIIIESNGYIQPQASQFLQDLAKQAAFYRHIPWHNLYLFCGSAAAEGELSLNVLSYANQK